jgi:hypothetical protein
MQVDDATKKILDKALDTHHKSGRTYRDVMDLYRNNGAGSVVAGGILRDALQGKSGMDVDIAMTCGFATTLDIAYHTGLMNKGTAPGGNGVKARSVQSLVHFYDDADGLDITSLRGYAYNAGSYGKANAYYASESCSFAEDAHGRDFACNSIFYDAENSAMIDVTGRGVKDAQDKVLFPGSNDFDGWLQENGPRHFARAFKFIARGYSVSPELMKLMKDNWLDLRGTNPTQPTKTGWSKAHANVSYGTEQKGWSQAKKAAQWPRIKSFLENEFADMPKYVKREIWDTWSWMQPASQYTTNPYYD